MNGMKQGLIIGAVAGLFFGFMLGRYGVEQDQRRRFADKGPAALTKMSDLRGMIKPKEMKGVSFKGVIGPKLVRAAYVLNKVACKCKGVRRSQAYCLKYNKRCKPNYKLSRRIISQIRDGVDYRRVLALYAPKGRRPHVIRPLPKTSLATIQRSKVVPSAKDVSWGPKNALVTIVEFSDFQCGYCARAAKTLNQIKKNYKGKVRIVFKHNPLSFHRQAHLASQASLAAHAQGKFWPYHDKLFANYRRINKTNLLKWAKELKLDMTKFKAAIDKGTYKSQVDGDLRYGRVVGVRGTPNFFINGRKLAGAYPYYRFKQIIDQEMGFARSLIKKGVKPSQLMAKLLAYGEKARQARIRLLKNIPVAHSPTNGPKTAKVTIYEFSDFQCPYCSRAAKTIDQVKKHYGNKVRVVFKHNPLSFHKQAHLAAQASMAANAQGKFWPYHDKLFANFRTINKANLIKWAKELKLDVARFTKELNSGKYKAAVDKDMALGRQIGVRGTPNFFINGQKIGGALPFARFKAMIDRALGVKTIRKARVLKRPRVLRPAKGSAGRGGVARVYIPADGPSAGPKHALVTIVEFSDFQCPFCQRGARTIDRVKREYKGKVRVVFKHRPLSFHRQAHLAAQASMAANAQGKFWPYHDKLFANFRSINKANLIKWAQELGLNVKQFTTELNGGTYKKHVDKDNALAVRVGAGGTPTFFINGRKLVGAQPYYKFKQVIDSEIRTAQALLKKGTALSGLYRAIVATGKAAAANQRKRQVRRLIQQRKLARTAIPLGNSPSFGPKNAKVVIVEFSDFQCPFCSRGARTIDQIKRAYKGKVRVVFKHRPLSFHKQAHIAAQASLAAHAQGKFWQYHDKLFANSRNINKANLLKWAKELGLDEKRFHKALDSGKYKAAVDADNRLAVRVGAGGTPTFFINGRKLVGAQPFHRFKAIIDAELRLDGKPRIVRRVGRQVMPRVIPPGDGGRPVVPVGASPTMGPKNAKITITEFSDFQCPFCQRGARTIKQVMNAYKGKVRLVFKHRPLSFHKQAHLAAQASMAAHAQGKFWAYHDKLFANYRAINKANLIKWAGELKLDVARFTKELNSGKYSSHVDKDNIVAQRIGAGGTPTFFIGTRKLVGAQPFYKFKKVIDEVLSGKAAPRVVRPARRARPRVVRPANPALAKKAVRILVKVNPNDVAWGPKDAPVTIVKFTDFQCGFCARGARTMDQVKKAFPGKVRIVYKHNPLSFHRQAHIAAQAALAAHAQGKFWQYHDKLFANMRTINKANLIKWAKETGLDMVRFKKALDSGKYKGQVDGDLAYGRVVGVRGTPNFFVNGRKVAGAYPFSHFQRIIGQELAYAKQLMKSGVKRGDLYAKFMEAGKKAAEAARVAKLRAAQAMARTLRTLDHSKAPSAGSKDAKVTILEFSDFQCPYCARAARTVDQIKRTYGDKVRVVFKHLPLNFHRQAHIAAQASMAAHAQGKFWAYHDKLFANYRAINKANLIKWAGELKLDVARFKKALDTGKYKAYVDKDLALTRRLGIRGTPNFLINGQKLVGAQPFHRFKAVIDAALRGKGIAIPRVAPPPRPRPVKPVKIPVGISPTAGPANAKVTIVEFSDFQCPFCSRGAKTIKQVLERYKGKVRVIFKHRPLSFHKQAHIAAQASMAAHAQGKFWEFHDKLFANSRNINKANLLKWAGELKLDVAKFKAALDKGTFKADVDKDNALAVRVGAGGTPTFFINGRKLVGAQPFHRFKAMIDAALSGKAPAAPPARVAPAPAKITKLNTNGAPAFGPANAPVTIVEFSDFQCPFCQRGANTVKQIIKSYGNKVRVVFMHRPLSFHKQAHLAAQASMAAHEQGKFWKYHDKLFANYRAINKANLLKWANEVELDTKKFKAALDSGKFKKYVDANNAQAVKVGASGTPTFFVNGRRIVGAQPFSVFKAAIDAALKAKKKQ